jgi:hypothetical protein
MVHGFAPGVLLCLIVGIYSLCVEPVRAALGSDVADVLTDSAEMQGVIKLVTGEQYDVQEIAAGTGMRVREYVNRDGLVFAVSWDGPVMPDLRQLLGSHYAAYTEALSALTHRGLRSVRVASSELVVESGGHMRAYSGRAYLPILVPPGVPVAELR